MTQEEKAKAYDEALENAKKAILKCRPLSIETNLTVAAILQLVFPQHFYELGLNARKED